MTNQHDPANFGLKAKKSVIHPRSASSSRTRFSISSDKSYMNGVNMSPVNSGFASFENECPHAKPEDATHSLINDDIEKKVHVNKDGSLSVEMKVRFRLLNEETLQWSTQIKKSSTLGKNKCDQLCLCDEDGLESKREMNSEFYSETDDSFYPCDADSYSSKVYDPELKDMYCTNCGMQCQDYDIWKNPMHSNQPEDGYAKRRTWQTQSPASSTTSQHNLTNNQKTSIDSLHTMSSEEFTEHIVHKSSRYSETRENGATRVTYSAVSQCTSRSSQSVASNKAMLSDNECTCTDNQCQGLKSSHSLQHQCSEHLYGAEKLKKQCGSIDGNPGTPSKPCSNCEDNGYQSAIFQPSPPLQKCHRNVKMRNRRDVRSLNSSMSCGEEVGQCTAVTTTQISKIKVISDEKLQLEDTCSEHTEHPSINGKIHSEITCNTEDGELACDSSRADPNESYNSSTRASSRTTITSNKKSLQNNKSCQSNRQGSCNSLGSSSFSKQNSEIQDDVSNGPCEEQENLSNPFSPLQLNKSETKKRQQTLHSNQSFKTLSSVTESTSSHEQDQPDHNYPEICEELLQNQLNCKSDDGKDSRPSSRPSTRSPCCSSKHDCVNCQENDKFFSMSSRVSTVSEQPSKCSESSGMHGCWSTKSNTNEQTHQHTEPDCSTHNNNASSKASDSEFECTYSPSPPQGNPKSKSQRLSKFKYSSGSNSSDQVKTVEKVEKSGSSRSSTPGSKGIVASRASAETCKKLTNGVNGTSDEINNKKRKHSSSSSKLKFQSERSDNGNKIQSELIPSALPNVSSEEVVHEWLSKIPSSTMEVDYELEDCQTKVCQEIHSAAVDTDQGDVHEGNDSAAEAEICNSAQTVGTGPVTGINESQTTLDSKKEEEENEDDHARSNNKGSTDPIHSFGGQKVLRNNIHTSVQIMKALLNPLQESKFDRSNSLPEISPAKGRKLSNSAQVLISCLASLQLLDASPTNDTEKSKDFKQPKYTELMNIFQALWAESSANTHVVDFKPRKIFSQEEELTPVSSSGVDVNSGYGGSGDGSIIGGSECPVVAEKIEEQNLANATVDIKDSNNVTLCSENPSVSKTKECGMTVIEGVSVYVDENMNEKKVHNRSSSLTDDKPTDDAGHLANDNDGIENLENSKCNNLKLNNLSHTDKNRESKEESNSQETNCINSSSDCQSTVVITSDSNGNSESNSDKQSRKADPAWILKLLKKIEKEFMTHYVDAMNEFKIRWNLENNDNLDEMIAELKNEVSQRIQRSITTEMKKIQSRVGQKVPRPPDKSSRRKFSLQAEERRKRLQTMHKRSALMQANGDNREHGTNDISCETDEEDLTFSASFGDGINGQPNDEFCPCETCIKKKRILMLEKPNTCIADAPIIKAFDLQQILRMKKGNNEFTSVGMTKIIAEELQRDISDSGPENGGTVKDDVNSNEKDLLSNSEYEDQPHSAKSECSVDESETEGHIEQSLKQDDDEERTSNDFHSETEENLENTDTADIKNDEEDELEHDNTDKLEKSSSTVSLSTEAMNVDCSLEQDAVYICDENQKDGEVDDSDDFNEDNGVEQDPASSNDESKAPSEDGDELNEEQAEGDLDEECYDMEIKNEEDVMNINENVKDDDTELSDCTDSYLHKPCMTQHSLITQNGSNEDAGGEYNEIKNGTGETSPNRDSNSSESKQCQMYPESSSEDEKGDSECGSAICANKNVTGTLNLKKNASFECSESGSRNDLQDETIDQDDLDF
uniref:Retinitis pigmentosa 1-like 1 protein n=1 Tax=Leptobrachium leishanense TaxID=445787 RepID=A0A8C5MF48_9ANUR